MLLCTLVLTFAVAVAAPSGGHPRQAPQAAQPPWKGENLQHFPKDITREQLTQRMREFSFALGVRCQYCHAGGNGGRMLGQAQPSLDTVEQCVRLAVRLSRHRLERGPERCIGRLRERFRQGGKLRRSDQNATGSLGQEWTAMR